MSIQAESLVRWLAQRWQSPLVAALCLGLLSTPFAVAAIVLSSTPPSWYYATVEPVSIGVALPIAFVAVTAAALAGGSLGGSKVREQPVLGLALVLLVAWPVAIVTVPLLPALLGWPYRGAFFCFVRCNPMIGADIPLSGVLAYAETLFFGLWGPVEVAAVLALIANVEARRHHRLLASAFTIAAFVALNFWNIVLSPGVLPAVIALIIGSVVWAAPYLVADDGSTERPHQAIPGSSNQPE